MADTGNICCKSVRDVMNFVLSIFQDFEWFCGLNVRLIIAVCV